VTCALWFRDRQAWRVIAVRYLPALAVLNLAWEALHVRLYTLWDEAQVAYIAFSVVHCTLGDILIGSLALLLSLVLLREARVTYWHWRRIAALTVLLGAAYTVFSEWMNITILRSWAYSERMPTLTFGGLQVGISPLLQWLFLPPLSLYLARRGLAAKQPNQHDENGDQQADHDHPAEQPESHHPGHH
jgi:hypothetical protein